MLSKRRAGGCACTRSTAKSLELRLACREMQIVRNLSRATRENDKFLTPRNRTIDPADRDCSSVEAERLARHGFASPHYNARKRQDGDSRLASTSAQVGESGNEMTRCGFRDLE
ncbi:hypothetical protein HN011_009223 [Eciton burchellii]|nr:hypothetical protein HN011_009223 [Eciton burchellii]